MLPRTLNEFYIKIPTFNTVKHFLRCFLVLNANNKY